jgi:MYXO-CTERM domain-containing protein
VGTNNRRLDQYFASVSTRKRHVANWRIYAAVTGSAMAMATNASAGVIYVDQVLTAGPVANVSKSASLGQSQIIALKSALGGDIGVEFGLGVHQSCSTAGRLSGTAAFAFKSGSRIIEQLFNGPIGGPSFKLKKLAFGANISTVPGYWFAGGQYIGRQSTSNNVRVEHGWASNATGVVGFRFTTTNAAWDYGWVRLSYTLGTNGLANSITATDWAYDTTGTLAAGEGASSAPEPSSTALAILAAGAAGVAALRRRRHELNQ